MASSMRHAFPSPLQACARYNLQCLGPSAIWQPRFARSASRTPSRVTNSTPSSSVGSKLTPPGNLMMPRCVPNSSSTWDSSPGSNANATRTDMYLRLLLYSKTIIFFCQNLFNKKPASAGLLLNKTKGDLY